jgi:hypothetical protein
VSAVAALAVAATGLSAGPLVGGTALGPAPAAAAQELGPLDRAVRRLQAAQRADGGFAPTVRDRRSDPSVTVLAALALASVGVHPADQPAKGTTLLAYLDRHADALTRTEDLARLVLVLRAAGEADRPSGSAALATLVARQRTDGSFPAGSAGGARTAPTALAAIALAGGDEAQRATAARAVAWLRTAYRRTGSGLGWGTTAGSTPRPDVTGLVLQALQAGPDPEFELSGGAQAYLVDALTTSGGYAGARAGRPTPQATATVLQGLRAVGFDPRQFSSQDSSPIRYLRRQQDDEGGFGDTAATAAVLPGLNGVAFPVRAVPRGSRRASAEASEPERAGAAAGGGGGGGAEAQSQAQASGNSDRDAPGRAGGSGSGPGGSSPAPGTSAPGAAAVPPGTTTSATPPTTTTTTTTGPTPPAGAADEVSGQVVGAGAAPQTAGVAAGGAGGEGDGDGPTIALGGLLVVAALGGAVLEGRGPRRRDRVT